MKQVAIMGVSGAVGQVMLRLLDERNFPVSQLRLLASHRSAGRSVTFRGREYPIEPLSECDFNGIDYVLASVPSGVSRLYAPRAAEAGAIVIDNSSAFRMERDVPLVVPEINARCLEQIPRGIVANPNCSTIQMVVALQPLHQRFGLRRVVVNTYQSVSGAGYNGVRELTEQTRALMNDTVCPEPETFPYTIAFNCIPQIGPFQEDGYSQEEHKMIDETRKILDLPDLRVIPTCVRVPILYSHCESLMVETAEPITTEQARLLWGQSPGVTVIDRPEKAQYPMPTPSFKQDDVFVGRIRAVPGSEHALAFWCVSDNLRKGAALNAVQIAENLIMQGSHGGVA